MLNEIMERLQQLTEEQQKDVLEYVTGLSLNAKRDYPRKKIRLAIDVLSGDEGLRTESRDISPSGVFINSEKTFEKGVDIQMAFSVPGQGEAFKLSGVVARVESAGMAVRFKNLEPQAREALNAFILTDFPDLSDSIGDPVMFRFEIAK